MVVFLKGGGGWEGGVVGTPIHTMMTFSCNLYRFPEIKVAKWWLLTFNIKKIPLGETECLTNGCLMPLALHPGFSDL